MKRLRYFWSLTGTRSHYGEISSAGAELLNSSVRSASVRVLALRDEDAGFTWHFCPFPPPSPESRCHQHQMSVEFILSRPPFVHTESSSCNSIAPLERVPVLRVPSAEIEKSAIAIFCDL